MKGKVAYLQAMKAYGGMKAQLQLLFPPALYAGEWPASRHSPSISLETTSNTHW
jgi:hypothetical protein